MTASEFNTQLSGVLTILVFFCLLIQFVWQRIIGTPDRQSRSASAVVCMTVVVVGQLSLSYLKIAPFGASSRGPYTYLLWLLSVIWWTAETVAFNLPIMVELWRRRQQQRPGVSARRLLGDIWCEHTAPCCDRGRGAWRAVRAFLRLE
ncbi:MAG: hypothetical protein QM692_15110 [Thermomicrobiales bacterium]